MTPIERRLRRTPNRIKFRCTAFTANGTPLVSRHFYAYGEEGARIQFDEWLEVHAPAAYNPDTILVTVV
ncbi:hypothetical protein [Larkinella arboricola]|uniref:Uncharacterized protein n=1 Tax=Larkinella arboricola TaxID=643671 RepID=A0A327X1E8_LARAB|nr:hypothetical protein [Larkinella arboricola]RAK00311.1 hypothetical protein LX87_02013 [Larkinella arboricola]